MVGSLTLHRHLFRMMYGAGVIFPPPLRTAIVAPPSDVDVLRSSTFLPCVSFVPARLDGDAGLRPCDGDGRRLASFEFRGFEAAKEDS